MLVEELCHSLEADCETASYELGYQLQDGSVLTQEDQKKRINFLAKECEKVEFRFILSDTNTTSSVNQSASSLSRKKLKSSLGEGTEENQYEGFQSPTNAMDTIFFAGLKCPPAPRKPKATPLMTKRKRESVNLQKDEFVNEVELVLSLLSSELEDKKLKKARLLAAGEIMNDEAMN